MLSENYSGHVFWTEIREAAKKYFLRGGGGVKGLPLRKKKMLTLFFAKFRLPLSSIEGWGGG